MAYTLTYKFGSALDVGEKLPGGHLVRMSIAFTVQTVGSDLEYFARDYGLWVKDWGELSWERDIDKNFLTPGTYTFEIFDDQGTLDSILFEGAVAPYVEKDALVTLDIKYYGDAGYTTVYTGYIDGTDLQYDSTKKIAHFSANPKTDNLKGMYLYDKNQDGSLSFNNPLSLTYSTVNGIYTPDVVNVQTFLHEIFKKINSSCTLEWNHNWLFWQTYPTTYKLNELSLRSEFLAAMFFSIDNLMNLETLDDVLKRLSFDYGFNCGMIHQGKAFVKEFFNYDSGNTQTLGTVKSFKKSFLYNDIEAVRITQQRYERNSDKKNGFWITHRTYDIIPSGSQLRGDNIIDQEILNFGNGAYPSYGGTLEYSGTVMNNFRVALSGSTTGSTFAGTLANFYYAIRNKKRIITGSTVSSIGRVDSFVVQGIQYDYTKDFQYEGGNYSIKDLRIKLNKNESEINAFYVTDSITDDTPDNGDPGPKPFANVLPSGYLRSYVYNSELDYTYFSGSYKDLFNIPAGMQLKSIALVFNTSFDNTTSMSITDNDGTLITSDEIDWEKADAKPILTPFFKNYSTDQTIKINFTGTPTQGDMDIVIELLTRN